MSARDGVAIHARGPMAPYLEGCGLSLEAAVLPQHQHRAVQLSAGVAVGKIMFMIDGRCGSVVHASWRGGLRGDGMHDDRSPRLLPKVQHNPLPSFARSSREGSRGPQRVD